MVNDRTTHTEERKNGSRAAGNLSSREAVRYHDNSEVP